MSKTVTIPQSVGSTSLTETFGKINLSPEVKELLSDLGAELNVRFIPGGEKPIIEVLSRTGDTVCSLEEFKALSGYRRFVSEVLKDLEKEITSDKKAGLIAFYMRTAQGRFALPARILEANLTKFNQIGSYIEIVSKNGEVIEETINDNYKAYLQDKSLRILRILYSAQMQCMGSEKLDVNYIENNLFGGGVPKWLYSKFIDRNFTNNLRRDASTLLFPKSNYLKAISLSTTEVQNEAFLDANRLVVAKSGAMFLMARTDWAFLYPSVSPVIQGEIDAFVAKYNWICNNPGTAQEILDQRLTGKAPPLFRFLQKPAIKAGNRRPETESQRICRDIANTLSMVQATVNHILNFVVLTANPRTEFWSALYPNAVNWDITPTNTIYNCIVNEGNMNPLHMLRNIASNDIADMISAIASQHLQVPHGSGDFLTVRNIIRTMVSRTDFVQRVAYVDTLAVDCPLDNLQGLRDNPITAEQILAAKVFMGMKTKIEKKTKISSAAAKRLSTAVLNELSALTSNPMLKERVKLWIATTFKSGKRDKLQLLAAERVVGEALKYQGKIFNDEFVEEEVLHDIEEYYSDDTE